MKKIDYRKQKSITQTKRNSTNKESSTRWAKKRKANKNHAAPVRNSATGMKFCITNLVSSENTSYAAYPPCLLGLEDWALANYLRP